MLLVFPTRHCCPLPHYHSALTDLDVLSPWIARNLSAWWADSVNSKYFEDKWYRVDYKFPREYMHKFWWKFLGSGISETPFGILLLQSRAFWLIPSHDRMANFLSSASEVSWRAKWYTRTKSWQVGRSNAMLRIHSWYSMAFPNWPRVYNTTEVFATAPDNCYSRHGRHLYTLFSLKAYPFGVKLISCLATFALRTWYMLLFLQLLSRMVSQLPKIWKEIIVSLS